MHVAMWTLWMREWWLVRIRNLQGMGGGCYGGRDDSGEVGGYVVGAAVVGIAAAVVATATCSMPAKAPGQLGRISKAMLRLRFADLRTAFPLAASIPHTSVLPTLREPWQQQHYVSVMGRIMNAVGSGPDEMRSPSSVKVMATGGVVLQQYLADTVDPRIGKEEWVHHDLDLAVFGTTSRAHCRALVEGRCASLGLCITHYRELSRWDRFVRPGLRNVDTLIKCGPRPSSPDEQTPSASGLSPTEGVIRNPPVFDHGVPKQLSWMRVAGDGTLDGHLARTLAPGLVAVDASRWEDRVRPWYTCPYRQKDLADLRERRLPTSVPRGEIRTKYLARGFAPPRRW
jgi:hypothetical protein